MHNVPVDILKSKHFMLSSCSYVVALLNVIKDKFQKSIIQFNVNFYNTCTLD